LLVSLLCEKKIEKSFLQFILPDQYRNGCDWLEGSECPLDVGEDVTWLLGMPVLEEYPLTEMTLEFSLFDNTTQVMCAVVLAQTFE